MNTSTSHFAESRRGLFPCLPLKVTSPLKFIFLIAIFCHQSAFASTVIAWGQGNNGQRNVPPDLTNAVEIAAGQYHSLAVRRDGTVVAWGAYDATNVPIALSDVVAVAAGWNTSYALERDGTVVAWGDNYYGQTNVPPACTNVMAISAGRDYALALRRDGTVVSWGRDQCNLLSGPAQATNVAAIAAGYDASAVLLRDGTVHVYGSQCYWTGQWPPADANNVAVTVGTAYGLLLTTNRTVVGWGSGSSGRYVPSDLTNVIGIAAGGYYGCSFAIQADGTVRSWGNNSYGQLDVPVGLTNVGLIAVGGEHVLAIFDLPPSFTANPENRTVYSGHDATFSAAAKGSPPLYYQWRLNGTNLVGATNQTLSVTNAQLSQAGSYSVVVQNAFGTNTSAKATLTVISQPPILLTQPLSQVIAPGREVNFHVDTAGSLPMSYQLSFNGVPISDVIIARTNADLAIIVQGFAQAGDYSIMVSNAAGVSVSSNAHLRVLPVAAWGNNDYGQANPPPTLTNVVAIAAGGYHSLALNADGTVTPWGAGTNWSGQNQNYGQSTPPGATNAVQVAAGHLFSVALHANGFIERWGSGGSLHGLTNAIAIAAGGDFSTALSQDGKVISSGDGLNPPANLSNVVSVSIWNQQRLALKADGTVAAWGSQLSLPELTNVAAISLRGQQALAIRNDGTVRFWYWNAQGTPITYDLPNCTNAVTASIGNGPVWIIKRDGGILGWEWSTTNIIASPAPLANPLAVSSSGHTLVLIGDGKPYVWWHPKSQWIPAGSNVTFSTAVAGDGPLRYQWQFNGVDMPNATNDSLMLPLVSAANAGAYRVVVVNNLGTVASTPAILSVLGVPAQIVTQPRSQTVPEGFSPLLAVSAYSELPCGYQWQFNGANIAGATAPTLTLSNILPAAAGNYTVLLSNAYSTVTSAVARITVTEPLSAALANTTLVWTTTGDAAWSAQTNHTDGGPIAAQSGAVFDEQQSALGTTVTGPGSLSFWWRVSSEAYYDFFRFYIDGTPQAQISGNVDWRQEFFLLSPGAHTLRWAYEKDNSLSEGQDAAWLANVSYTSDIQPHLIHASLTNGEFRVSAFTFPGKLYFLDHKDSLSATNWVPGTSLVGDGTMRTFTDAATGHPSRVYRVRMIE